ncbi:hypothetical protein HGRIS_008999 [Hohenbuehelia grisea]|uniref:Nucleolar pre-ribosomal-associated protein 1 n=1 Tax=Hohenbuehelia grisea TaxID=104357 RepID=A0ABR3J061_9AGAR
MSSNVRASTGKRSDGSKPSVPVIKAEDIPHMLKLSSGSHETLIEGLTSLRNHFSLPSHSIAAKPSIRPQDERLILAQAYLSSFPGATHVFEVWDALYSSASSSNSLPPHSTKTLVAVVSLLAVLLNLLSTHYTSHAHGHAIIKTLLQPTYAKALSIYVAGAQGSKDRGSNNDLVLVTMKLWVAMAEFAGGKETQKVVEAFGWDLKVIAKLLTMRRRAKSDVSARQHSLLIKPDIRTLTICFLLSPLSTSSFGLKHAYLTTSPYTDALGLIWKGLKADESGVIRFVLESVWQGIWSDKSVARKDKVALFGESVFNHLVEIYDRSEQTESGDSDDVPANLVHHFLLALCTRPNTGICYQDRGWLPRASGQAGQVVESTRDEGGEELVEAEGTRDQGLGGGTRRIHNKILSNVLKMLKVNEDSRQQELAIRIMQACPELVAGYWSSSGISIEPRLSIKWITNMALVGTIISLPVPESSFCFQSSLDANTAGQYDPSRTVQYSPVPPPLSTILDNILPSHLHTKLNLSKALSTSSSTTPLMQHCAAQTLLKALMKLEAVLNVWSKVEASLGESADDGFEYVLENPAAAEGTKDGLWVSRRREIIREIRKRLPDFQVIVAFTQLYQHDGQSPDPGNVTLSDAQKSPVNTNKVGLAFLAEAGQRLLWMYHKCLPDMVAEARFDVGKLLAGFSLSQEGDAGLSVDDEEDEGDETKSADRRLEVLRKLHVLRLLEVSEGFAWSGKSAFSPATNFYHLLSAYTRTTSIPAIRHTLHSIIARFLAKSILFQTSGSSTLSAEAKEAEPSVWLQSLPTMQRAKATEAPDGATLTDERESVVAFLDDCVSRCLKKAYAYMEDMQQLVGGAEVVGASQLTALPSPLSMTVVEQLKAKLEHDLLTPSDVLAIVTFLRKLVLRLMGVLPDLVFLRKYVVRIDAALQDVTNANSAFKKYPGIRFAVKRELHLMHVSIDHICGTPIPESPAQTSSEVESFLLQVEDLLIPSTKHARVTGATELLDWMRVAKQPLRATEIRRIAAVLQKFYPPALHDLVEHLDLVAGLLWDGLVLQRSLPAVPFEWLYVHSNEAHLSDEECTKVLLDAIFSQAAVDATAISVLSAIRLIAHGISSSINPEQVGARLSLLGNILQRATNELPRREYVALKDFVFCRCRQISELYMTSELPDGIFESLSRIVHTLSPNDAADCSIARDLSSYWLESLRKTVQGGSIQIRAASPWIPFISPDNLFALFDSYSDNISDSPTADVAEVLRLSLDALQHIVAINATAEEGLQARLDQLVSIRPLLPGSYVLEGLIASAIEARLPLGHDGHDARHQFGSAAANELQDNCNLASLVQRSTARWARRLDRSVVDLDLRKLLFQTSWSGATVRMICGLLYSQPFSEHGVLGWIQSDNCAHRSTHDFAIILHAFLDVTLVRNGNVVRLDHGDAFLPHFERLFAAVIDSRRPAEMQAVCGWCASQLLVCLRDQYPKLVEEMSRQLDKLHYEYISPELLKVALRLLEHPEGESKDVVDLVVSHALQWAVRYLGETEHRGGDEIVFRHLASLVTKVGEAKAHLAEPVLVAIIQHHLSHTLALRLGTALCEVAALKPVVVNRQIQSILQHPHWARTSQSASDACNALVDLLFVLFKLHPNNTCQSSHIEPLIYLYKGTLSPSDRKLFAIFGMFERERQTSVASLFGAWSSIPGTTSASVLESLQSLDAGVVLRTSLAFPRWRRLEDQCAYHAEAHEMQLYDPVFVMLLVSQMFVDCVPTTAFAWVELFRTNVFGLIVRALSAKDDIMREMAVSQLAVLWKHLETADLQEKPHVVYVLNLLKDALPPPSGGPVIRLPSYTTLVILHALRAIFYPSNFIYPLTSTFLLQRPELDVKDVPMLLGMLYSSSDGWKKERGWIIRFLSDGMASSGDWRVLRRRHTWDLLASMFQGDEKDRALRSAVLEVLANATCNQQATTALLIKSGLLAWIEMQLPHVQQGEAFAWAKILENISSAVDPRKLDTSTRGEWRVALYRCLALVLDVTSPALLVHVLPIVASTVLRLSLLPGAQEGTVNAITLVIDKVLLALGKLEGEAKLPPATVNIIRRPIDTATSSTPHTSWSLAIPPQRAAASLGHSEPEPLHVWGYVVECTWRSAMTLEEKNTSWSALSSRILVWRSFVGAEKGDEASDRDGIPSVAEWVRREVVQNLHA